MFLEDIVPSLVGDKRYVAWYAKLERLAASPGAAVALARMAMEIDVRDVLPTIHVPVLVLHRRDDRAIPIEERAVHRRACARGDVRRAPGRGPLAVDRATTARSRRSRSS